MNAIAIAAAGMHNDQVRFDAISQNLANALTPAYRRSIALQASMPDGADVHWRHALTAMGLAGSARPDGASAVFQAGAAASAVTPVQIALDFTPGTLRFTGNPLDVAVEGPGFIEIISDKGAAYSRQGSLHIDAHGRLVTAQGDAVMGMAGEIAVGSGAVTIDRNGDVREEDAQFGSRVVGRIRLAHFDRPESLVPLGNGRFAPGPAGVAQVSGDSAVRSAYLENSNVVTASEMIRLTEVLRHFESLQKLVQGYDDALDKSMRKLGEF
jgi:flagellar basal body rod protein FlgG